MQGHKTREFKSPRARVAVRNLHVTYISLGHLGRYTGASRRFSLVIFPVTSNKLQVSLKSTWVVMPVILEVTEVRRHDPQPLHKHFLHIYHRPH